MKDLISKKWGMVLLSAFLPLAGGCLQDTSKAGNTTAVVTNQGVVAPAVSAAVADPAPAPTNAPPVMAPETDDALANAPIKEVTMEKAVPAGVNPTPAVAEVVKLANSGVDEAVMTAYVNNATSRFELNADEIVYLKDIGVPPPVVTAMIERDQVLKTAAAPAPAPAANPAVAGPNPAEVAPQVAQPSATTAVPNGPPAEAVDNSSFYSSLAPYGRWMEVDGYGMVWQPTVVVVNSGWQPYFNDGQWLYTDCGWYWNSYYSWGWAPFHYGRWFRHARVGWCWAPDTCWGPSWVTWRYSPGYCGWAPLPPSACYRPGFGFSYYGSTVGFGFSFGLGVDCYAFVSSGNLCSPHPHHYAVPHEQVNRIYQNSTVVTRIAGRNNTIVNHGIDVTRVSHDSGVPIRRVALRDTVVRPTGAGRGEHLATDARSIPVYRPQVAPINSPVTRLSDRTLASERPAAVTAGRASTTRLVDRSQVAAPTPVPSTGAGRDTTAPTVSVPRPTTPAPTASLSDSGRTVATPSSRVTAPRVNESQSVVSRSPRSGSSLTDTPSVPSAVQRPTAPSAAVPMRPAAPQSYAPQSAGTESAVTRQTLPSTRATTPGSTVTRSVPNTSVQRPTASPWSTPQASQAPSARAVPTPSYQAPSYQAPSYQVPAPVTRSTPSYSYQAPSYQAPKFQNNAPTYQAPAPVMRPTAPAYQAPAPQISRPTAPAPSYSAPAAPSRPTSSGSVNQGGGSRRSDR